MIGQLVKKFKPMVLATKSTNNKHTTQVEEVADQTDLAPPIDLMSNAVSSWQYASASYGVSTLSDIAPIPQ